MEAMTRFTKVMMDDQGLGLLMNKGAFAGGYYVGI